MQIKTKQPSLSIPSTPELIVLFIKGTLKVQDIVKLYGYVSLNYAVIPQYEELKQVIDNVTINFILEGMSIKIVSANYEILNWQNYFFKPSLHFMARLIENNFDLNIFVPLYKYIQTNELTDGEEIEVDCRSSSIVFVKYHNTYKLITAWRGSRNKVFSMF